MPIFDKNSCSRMMNPSMLVLEYYQVLLEVAYQIFQKISGTIKICCNHNLNREILLQRNEPRHEKTNVLVSNLVRHKPGCTVTEDG